MSTLPKSQNSAPVVDEVSWFEILRGGPEPEVVKSMSFGGVFETALVQMSKRVLPVGVRVLC